MSTVYLFNNRLLQTTRYPFDPYDRLWQSYGDVEAWTNITTSTAVDVSNITNFDTPSKILWSAATPVNGTRINFAWSPDPSAKNNNTTYLLLLYFAELQRLPRNALRQFDILVDNATWNRGQRYTPKYLSMELVKRTVQGSSRHTVSLVATPDATLPPILNAFEIYSLLPMTELPTNEADGICSTILAQTPSVNLHPYALCCMRREALILIAIEIGCSTSCIDLRI
jgi:hypothetical protein